MADTAVSLTMTWVRPNTMARRNVSRPARPAPSAEVRKWLRPVHFPATRTHLLAAVLREPAPDWLVEYLGRLPEDTAFDDVDQVLERR